MTTATLDPATGRADLVLSLLRVALDPEAHIGEAENAAEKMVRIARRENVAVADLIRFGAVEYAIQAAPPKAHRRKRPDAWRVVMPFGKHQGKTLGEIALSDPDYLIWAAQSLDRKPGLVASIEAVLNHLVKSEAA